MITQNVKEYLSQIGKKGGKSRSLKKQLSSRKNARKARLCKKSQEMEKAKKGQLNTPDSIDSFYKESGK